MLYQMYQNKTTIIHNIMHIYKDVQLFTYLM